MEEAKAAMGEEKASTAYVFCSIYHNFGYTGLQMGCLSLGIYSSRSHSGPKLLHKCNQQTKCSYGHRDISLHNLFQKDLRYRSRSH